MLINDHGTSMRRRAGAGGCKPPCTSHLHALLDSYTPTDFPTLHSTFPPLKAPYTVSPPLSPSQQPCKVGKHEESPCGNFSPAPFLLEASYFLCLAFLSS